MPGPLPRLIVITDPVLPFGTVVERLEAVLAAGPGIAIQLRAPQLGGAALLVQARTLAALCRRFDAPLFVNGRVDVALAVGAHLHLPAHGFSVAECRPLIGERWISVAVHDGEEERAAGADLALVSPVFTPGSKPSDTRTVLGGDGFDRLVKTLRLSACFALGGMTPERTRLLRPAGVAVLGAVLHAPDPGAVAKDFLAALDSCDPRVP